MNKNISLLTLLVVSIIILELTTYCSKIDASGIIMDTIQFPQSLSTIPMVRVYARGKKIPYDWCIVDNNNKQFTFCIPHDSEQLIVHLLITQAVYGEKVQSRYIDLETANTIGALKIAKNQDYKFYELAWTTEEKPETKQSTSFWQVTEQQLPSEKIPDDAIIILYDASSVDLLKGGSTFELPTIVLKKDLLATLGSEDKLIDLSNTLLLSSIDTDTIHAPIHQEIKKMRHVNIVTSVT